jgi:hypothetical protein
MAHNSRIRPLQIIPTNIMQIQLLGRDDISTDDATTLTERWRHYIESYTLVCQSADAIAPLTLTSVCCGSLIKQRVFPTKLNRRYSKGQSQLLQAVTCILVFVNSYGTFPTLGQWKKLTKMPLHYRTSHAHGFRSRCAFAHTGYSSSLEPRTSSGGCARPRKSSRPTSWP